MTYEEYIEMLGQGADVWNAWRREHWEIRPDLSGADLHDMDLARMDLSEVDLTEADLRNADLGQANLRRANLNGADLSDANLRAANLRGANLAGADLPQANLVEADLRGAYVNEANLWQTSVGWTNFGDIDLRGVVNLEMALHYLPSTVGIDTIVESGGDIPESFLRECGVPETFIRYARSLIGSPIEFYSCFLSHSSADKDFAERLYSDLQNEGVRCWHYRHHMRGGRFWRTQIDEAIKVHDKLVLICSEASMLERNVVDEIVAAMEKERETGSQKLFPIRLDNFILGNDVLRIAEERMKAGLWREDWVRYVRAYHIPDFSTWQTDYPAYQREFQRLLDDLKSPPPR